MTTKRIVTLACVGALAAVSAVAISATTWIGASAAPGELRLHLGTDAQRFSYGASVQNLTVKKCAIESPNGTLISLTSTPGPSAPGLVDYGLGVKASPSSATGTPCGQLDQAETLTMARGSALGNRTFSGVRLDLEMTKDAVVKLTLTGPTQSAIYTLQTGSGITPDQAGEPGISTSPPYLVSSGPGDEIDACAAPNSSGPNSGSNDNCQWTVLPGFNFTSVNLATTTGTVTLEGGADFGAGTDHDSLFFVSNAAPSAVADVVTTNEDTAAPINVLSNDSDPDGDTLSVTSSTPVSHGTLVAGAAPGSFTYTPATNYNGPDSFSYTISDGSVSATANVSITVNAVNDPPVAVNSNPTTAEETAVTITVGTDVDSTQLTATCTAVPPGGTITDNGNGSITYTPPLNFNGTVTVTCTIKDDKGATSQSTATVTVAVTPVNDAPSAADDTAQVNQNRSNPVTNESVLIPVLANDSDADAGDTLTPASVSDPANGSATVEGVVIRYTPDPDFIGTDTFTYRADDGHAQSSTATVTVTVIRVMCSGDEVSDVDGQVGATFVLLTPGFCKPYTLDAVASSSFVLFQPVGDSQVDYRGVITFGPKALVISAGAIQLLLEYDPDGGENFKPVQWCDNPAFDANGTVTSAEVPPNETWCIASETTVGQGTTNVVTTWQVWGHDDPKFH